MFKTFFIISIFFFSADACALSGSGQPNLDQSLNIEADTLFFDREKDLIHAKGNVFLQQGNQSLIANEIWYNKTTEDLYAFKDIAIKRENGDIFFSDKAVLNKRNNQATILNFKGRMGEQGLLASNSLEIVNKDIITLKKVVYSPCKVCKENFIPDQPLWQVRAKDMTINKEEEKVYFNDATIEGFGIPFFYVPYFSMPSPNAKRKSGLLTPKYSYSNEFGSGVRVPYYFNIAPNFDITYSPSYFQKERSLNQKDHLLHEIELRHSFEYGSHEIKLYGTNTHKISKSADKISEKKSWRGFYDYKGKFNFPMLPGEVYIDSKMVRDPTKIFPKKYKISKDDILNSDVNYQSLSHNYYYQLRTLYFQDLRPNTNRKTTPSALPILNLHYNNPFIGYGLTNTFDFNYLNLIRDEGSKQQRYIGMGSLEKKLILPKGFLFKTKASIRGDLYQVDYKNIKVSSNYRPQNQGAQGSETRLYSELSNELSWPLYNNYGNTKVIIEPVVMAILSPNVNNLKKADNEDSQDPEISASNLFRANRYKGYDRLESGTRFNYGIRTNIKAPWIHNLNFILGQNYRFKKDTNFLPISGLNKLHSDYVTKVSIQPTKEIYLNDAMRFDQKTLKILRHEMSLTLNNPKYNLTLHYSAVKGTIIDDPSKLGLQRKEIALTSSFNFYKNWWLDAGIVRKLGKKRLNKRTPMISDSVGLKHLTECLITTFTISRDFTSLKDLKPSTSYIFKIDVPTF